MAESEGSNPNFGSPDDSDKLTVRQSIIERAHAMALDMQEKLNERLRDLEDDDEARANLIQNVVEWLKLYCGHAGRPIVVNGYAQENTADPTTLHDIYDPSDESTEHFGYMVAEKVDRFNLKDKMLLSLGYAAVRALDIYPDYEGNPTDVIIRHLAVSQPRQLSNPNQSFVLGMQTTFELPVNGSGTTVELVGEQLPPDIKTLRDFVPDLISKTDEIINSDKTIYNKLHDLSLINLGDFPILQDEFWKELKSEYINYLNQGLQSELTAGLYKVTGIEDMIIPLDGRYHPSKLNDPKKSLRMPLLSLRYKPQDKLNEDTTPKLAVSGMGYIKNRDWNELIITLTPGLKFKPDSLLKIKGLEKNELPPLLQMLLGAMGQNDSQFEDIDLDDDEEDPDTF